jgi:DNA-directed RNA polymerase beta subunit
MIDFTAHPFFPDLLENQRRSVHSFFEKGILDELELFSYVGSGGLSQASIRRKNTSRGAARSSNPRGSVQSRKSSSPRKPARSSDRQSDFPNENLDFSSQDPRASPFFKHLGGRRNFPEAQTFSFGSKVRNWTGYSAAPEDSKKEKSQGIGSSPQRNLLSQLIGSKGFFPPGTSLQLKNSRLGFSPLTTSNLGSGTTSGSQTLLKTSISADVGTAGSSLQSQPPLRRTNYEILLHTSKFVLKKPQFSEMEAIRQQKTYSAGFYLPVEIREIQEPSPGLGPISRARNGPNLQKTRKSLENNSSLGFGGATPAPARWFYFGEIPLMTERGSFLINGAPRVLVNQIVRCPSVYFKLKVDEKNRRSYIASFLSDYGSWLRLETDRLRPRLWVRIDKSPRFPIEFLFQALGFGASRVSLGSLSSSGGGTSQSPPESRVLGSGGVPGSAPALQMIWKKCNPGRWGSALSCYSFFYNKFFNPRRYSIGRVGRLRLNKRLNRRPDCEIPTLTPEDVLLALDYLIQLQEGLGKSSGNLGTVHSQSFHRPPPTLDDIDHLKNRRVRLPGEIIQNQFRLALSRVLGSAPLSRTTTQVGRKFGGNPSSPESFQNTEFEKLDSAVTNQNQSAASFFGGSPSQSFVSTLRELFNTSQLSQYMDQTNPLAEITHKRRLSSLGPGGVSRDQAGFAVREIHPSHFGRICPIETPEGQNAGLVGSLASYARINSDGFLQSPAFSTQEFQAWSAAPNSPANGARDHALKENLNSPAFRARDAFLFTADIEDEVYLCTADIGQALEKYAENGGSSKKGTLGTSGDISPDTRSRTSNFEAIPTRFKQEFITLSDGAARIQFRGICPIQMISVATSLIPFLEHDDANRALMGSNMQRQAVPLMISEKAFVGTGFELQAARDSSTLLLAQKSGYIEALDSQSIVLSSQSPDIAGGNPSQSSKTFENLSLIGYSRSNQSTCLRQRPAVLVGDWVEAGDLLADGSATQDGEVSLGKNILLAYLPWEGYNFEDAIVVNERLVYEDIYTSVHIERYELDVRNIFPLRFFAESDQESLETEFTRQSSSNSRISDSPDSARGDEPAGVLSEFSEISEQSRGEARTTSNRAFPPGASSMWPPRIGTEYLTGDLDILRGTPTSLESAWDSGAMSQMKSWALSPDGTAPENIPASLPFNASTATLAEQIRNLDSDGVVQPGTWVEESSILIGKVTVQAAPSNRKGFDRPAGAWGKSQSSSALRAQNPGSSPEYRLLLAILGGGPGASLSSSEGGVNGQRSLPLNKIGKTKNQRGAGGTSGTKSPLRETQSFIRFQNSSIKAGLGLRGRVLECILPWREKEPSKGLVAFGSALSATKDQSKESGSSEARGALQSSRSPSLLQIFIAHKKRIQVGDKMSGRHGNKGILSLILPPQDMPYLQDGTPVDIVLNPLGVPSRMNVGQVLESLLGLAAQYLGEIYRVLPFEPKSFDAKIRFFAPPASSNNPVVNPETSRSLVYSKLREARNRTGYPWLFDPNSPGKMQVFDGRTGELFHQPILVGYSYIFKLIHLVDDKIHARSTGPYSLVTQQPLGGRSKKGGQRLGEMEVWALEGFGAAYLLQEFLTLKSDEIYSRNTFLLNLMKRSAHRAALRVRPSPDWGAGTKLSKPPGSAGKTYVPESFRVLVNELQSLCLSVYYNPDFRLSYPSLLGRESTFSGLDGFLSEKVD